MTLPLVALPVGTAKPMTDRLQIKDSADGLERFDLLACKGATDEALRLALARSTAVRALVLAAAALPSDLGLIERYAALKIPTLLIFGTRDEALPPDAGRRWHAALPACHIVLLYDAGHDLAADRPQAFADLVEDFLSDPGAFLVNRRNGELHP
jgi:pimeloyl-ACP methyl ester carboxylesterase